MKVQRVQLQEQHKVTWLVLGEDYLPIQPIEEFLTYLRNLERSPNTVKAYAHHLKLYWEFLQGSQLGWKTISLTQLANFVAWLRNPQVGVISLQEQKAKRTEATVNVIITAVYMFYDFHERTSEVADIPLYGSQIQLNRRYKSFLHHINKSKPVRSRLIKLKESKHLPKILTQEQVKVLIDACHRLRNKFLICLLYESGLRIGQALGLRHEDVRSVDNLLKIVPRDNNPNGVRTKSRDIFQVDVSKELMEFYSDYLLNEFDETNSDFVFVNLWDGVIGRPMTYGAVLDLFRRLSLKVGFTVRPHMLRHTHATNLIREGWDAAHVQKRLGHRQVQTVLNTYTHLSNEDMKQAYKDYLNKQGRAENENTTDSMV